MTKILIIGTSCVGKSTMAKKISEKLPVQYIDLDDLYWLPNWQVQDEKTFISDVSKICQKDNWVISGNYSKVQPLLIEATDHIIWLDYSMPRILFNFFKRTSLRFILKTKCCNGNQETLKDSIFSKNSLLMWILTTHKKRTQHYNNLYSSKQGEINLHRFTTQKAAKKYLKGL